MAGEMRVFLDWFNRETGDDPVIKAALASLKLPMP